MYVLWLSLPAWYINIDVIQRFPFLCLLVNIVVILLQVAHSQLFAQIYDQWQLGAVVITTKTPQILNVAYHAASSTSNKGCSLKESHSGVAHSQLFAHTSQQ